MAALPLEPTARRGRIPQPCGRNQGGAGERQVELV